MAVCTVTTLRVPSEEATAFVRHQLRAGVDRMLLFFDDPDVRTREVAVRHPSVTSVRCDPAHWRRVCDGGPRPRSVEERQIANANHAFRELRRTWSPDDWIVHLDCDELVHAHRPIHELLDDAPRGTDVLRFPTAEAVPDKLRYHDYFREVTLFKRPTAHPTVRRDGNAVVGAVRRGLAKGSERSFELRAGIARRVGCRTAFRYGFFLGHTSGKSAVRLSAPVESLEIHVPRPRPGRRLEIAFAPQGWLLHYDACGFEVWKRKWGRRLDGSAPADRMRPARIRQLEAFAEARASGRSGALSALYRDLHLLRPREVVALRALGFLARLRVS